MTIKKCIRVNMKLKNCLFLMVMTIIFLVGVPVWAVSLGDLNEDSSINSIDCVLMKRYILGINTDISIEVADVNDDNNINSIDYALIEKYLLGTINKFPASDKVPDGSLEAEIDKSVTYQTIEGFGASIAYYGNWLPAHPNKDEIYDLIFKDLGTSVLRLNNWSYQYESSSSFDPDIKEIVEKANESLGEPIKIFMSSWTPAYDLKNNNSKAGGSLKKENGKFVYNQFADYWYESLQAYAQIGIEPDYISIQNEPDIETSYESCKFEPYETDSYASYSKALNAVYNKLNSKMDNPPKILGPEVLGIGYGNLQKYTDTMDLKQVDGIAFHLYHGGDENNPDSFNERLSQVNQDYNNKLKYQSEYYRGDAFNTAWIMHNSLTVGNVNMYLFWNLIWGDKDGLVTLENSWNTSSWTTEKGYIISDKYYAFKQYSKFIQPGYKRIDASVDSSDIKISAYLSPDNNSITIVLLNTSYEEEIIALDLNDFSVSSSKVYRTNDNEKTKFIGELGNGNSVELPAKSIVTVVIN